MSTATFVPTAEQLESLNTVPQDINPDAPKLRSTFAKKILSLGGDEERARRADYCGRYHFRKDRNGHKARKVQRCMLPFCPDCAIRRAIETHKRWREKLQEIAKANAGMSNVVFLRVSLPRPERSRADAAALLQEYNLTEPGFALHWTALTKYDGNNLIIKFLFITSIEGDSPESWVSLFPPEATVEVHIQPICRLDYYFSTRLLDPETPKAATDRAEQEVLFAGMRRFRSYGVTMEHKAPEGCDLFAEDVDLANISEMDIESLTVTPQVIGEPQRPIILHAADKCPICGEEYEQQSQMFHSDEPDPVESDLRWYDIRR